MGSPTFINAQTATNSTTLSFTSGLDSTYYQYMFVCNDIHPETDGAAFSFQCSTDGGSSYATTTTSNTFRAYHFEDGSGGVLAYDGSTDQHQGTAFQWLAENFGADNDQSGAVILKLYSPSNTTFVKQYTSRCSRVSSDDNAYDFYLGGYFNTTSAINAIQFKMSSGNFNGYIQMYGIL